MNSLKTLLAFFLFVSTICCVLTKAEEQVKTSGPRVVTLKEAFNTVLQSDQSIQIAVQAIKQADLQTWSALTTYGPRLNGSLTFAHTGDTTRTTPASEGSAGFSLQQTMFDATVFPNYRFAKLGKMSSRLQHAFTIREVLFAVTQSYFNVLKNEDLLKLNQQTLELATSQLNLAQTRYEAGAVAHTDVLRARVDVQNAKQSVIETENTLAFTKSQLGNILGYPTTEEFTLVTPTNLTFDEEPLAAALQRAYTQREDYQVSSLDIDKEKERKQASLAGYAPRVVGSLQQNWSDFTHSKSDSGWDASVGLSLPIFEGGQREIDIKSANYSIATAELNHEKLRKSIQDEIEQAWYESRSLRESLKTLSVTVEAAEQTYRDVKAQYEAGAATSVDTLVALRDLNRARTDLNTVTYNYQIALYNLKRATADLKEDSVQ